MLMTSPLSAADAPLQLVVMQRSNRIAQIEVDAAIKDDTAKLQEAVLKVSRRFSSLLALHVKSRICLCEGVRENAQEVVAATTSGVLTAAAVAASGAASACAASSALACASTVQISSCLS